MFKGQEMYSLSYLAFLGLYILYGVSETPESLFLLLWQSWSREHIEQLPKPYTWEWFI